MALRRSKGAARGSERCALVIIMQTDVWIIRAIVRISTRISYVPRNMARISGMEEVINKFQGRSPKEVLL